MTPEETKLRLESVYWYSNLSHTKRIRLKERYLYATYIPFDAFLGYDITLGQIEELYTALNWDIYKWIEDGNIIFKSIDTYATQDAQWQNAIKGYANLRNYFVKEFII